MKRSKNQQGKIENRHELNQPKEKQKHQTIQRDGRRTEDRVTEASRRNKDSSSSLSIQNLIHSIIRADKPTATLRVCVCHAREDRITHKVTLTLVGSIC